MSFYIAPYRIKSQVFKDMDAYHFRRLISGVRKRMIDDMSKLIKEKKIANPTVYMLEKKEPVVLGPGHDIVMAFFIGDALNLTPILRDEKWSIFEVLKVTTSERGWVKKFKDMMHELTTGEKPDPRTLNPYSR